MKKLIVLIGMMLSSVCLAENNIYCPGYITCSIEDDIASCKAINGDNRIWSNMRSKEKIEKAIYLFYSAFAANEYATDKTSAQCVYKYKVAGSKVNKYITIDSKYVLLANIDGSGNDWCTEGIGSYYYCSSDSMRCPFQ